MLTIVEMLERNAEYFPEKTAIIYKDLKISYKKLYCNSNALANFLISIGVEKGSTVGLLVRNKLEVITSFLGAATAGAIIFPIDYTLTQQQMQDILHRCHPAVLIVDACFQQLLASLRSIPDNIKIVSIGKKKREEYYEWEEIMDKENPDAPKVKITGEDIAYLNFTSGTTGFPKGAITTYSNIYWNTLSVVEAFSLTEDDVHLCMFPPYCHPHELFARALFLVGTVVLVNTISPKSIASAVMEYHVTCMMATASIYETIFHLPERYSSYLASMRLCESGGMFAPPKLVQEFKKRFKVAITPVWGSTETTGVALASSINGENKPGSMGKPAPYYKIKIVGEDGNQTAVNDIGEMAIKGPAVNSGYFGDSEETHKHMKDGWYFTGDMVKKDSEGYFYFFGRKNGLIKVGGVKVFPLEIENVLKSFPMVAEVAVVGIRDERHGEIPKAFIVLRNGNEVTKNDLLTYCKKRLAKPKMPRLIEFRKELPKTGAGKILYRELSTSF